MKGFDWSDDNDRLRCLKKPWCGGGDGVVFISSALIVGGGVVVELLLSQGSRVSPPCGEGCDCTVALICLLSGLNTAKCWTPAR